MDLLAELPSCANTCLLTALANSTCGPTDLACTCTNAAVMNQANVCIQGSCTVVEILSALNVTNRLCGIEPAHDYSWIAPAIVLLCLMVIGTTHERDILYVKCSPPSVSNGTHSQWNGAMRAAVASLGERYATSALCFILGVGMAWLPFYWDPKKPAPAGQALKMAAGKANKGEGDRAEGWYQISPEVRSPPSIDAGHIDAEGVIRTDRARFLDCFTVVPPQEASEVPRLAFQADLDFLGQLIGSWRDMLMSWETNRTLSDGEV